MSTQSGPEAIHKNSKTVKKPTGVKIIAVLGMTGVGKSTMIKELSGDESIAIGHSQDSETSEVSATMCNINGEDIMLLDTPGFDDSRPEQSDTEVLKNIGTYLAATHLSGNKLSGKQKYFIFYFFRDNFLAPHLGRKMER